MRPADALSVATSILLICLPCFGQAKNLAAPSAPSSAVAQESLPLTRDCTEDDWGLLDTAEAKNLLSDYDFDPFLPGRCKSVDVKWLPSAQIVRLDAVTAGVDDFREITLLRASHNSRLWLIPIEKGMVGFPETPSNPHHLAAFNDLLRVAQLKITQHNLLEVSDLYQFLVGMPVKVNPHPPKTWKDAISANDTPVLIEHKDGHIDFTHYERAPCLRRSASSADACGGFAPTPPGFGALVPLPIGSFTGQIAKGDAIASPCIGRGH